MAPKDVAMWLSIGAALAGAGAAWRDAVAEAKAAQAAVAQVEAASKEAHGRLESSITEVRSEGRGTRDMAIETRSQVAQILSGLARLEQAIEKRTLVIRQARGGE